MRKLTAKQKGKIDKFIEECKNKTYWDGDTWLECPYIVPDNAMEMASTHVMFLWAESMPREFYKEMVKMNDYETLHQDISRYMHDQCAKLTHGRKHGKD